MTQPTDTGIRTGSGLILGTATLGAVVVAGAVAFVTLRGDPPADTTTAATTATAAEQGDPTNTAAPTPDVEQPPPRPEGADADPLPPVPPRFDVVRVDPTGNAVIAGQASALSRVTILLDGQTIDAVTADAGGGFAAVLTLPPSDSPRILSLLAELPDGATLEGGETVIIAPFAGEAMAAATPEATTDPAAPLGVADLAPPPDTAPTGDTSASAPASPPALPPTPPPAQSADPPGVGEVTGTAPDAAATRDAALADTLATALPAANPEAAPSPQTDVAARPSTAPPPARPSEAEAIAEATAQPPAVTTPQTVPQAPDTTPVAPEAPAVLLADRDGIRVLQPPGAPPAAVTDLQLDAITYDLVGDVTLAGRGPADASVRITLNNQPINLGEIGPGGQWSLALPDVDPGTYTLRLEQVAADGTVTTEIETPFLREDPARIRDNPMLVEDGASVITVQRGFTLWGIAEANFGEGIRYVQIFEENRDTIRDPDRIFPGQIFSLPDLPRRGAGE